MTAWLVAVAVGAALVALIAVAARRAHKRGGGSDSDVTGWFGGDGGGDCGGDGGGCD